MSASYYLGIHTFLQQLKIADHILLQVKEAIHDQNTSSRIDLERAKLRNKIGLIICLVNDIDEAPATADSIARIKQVMGKIRKMAQDIAPFVEEMYGKLIDDEI